MKYTMRELFMATLIIAIGFGWFLEHRRSNKDRELLAGQLLNANNRLLVEISQREYYKGVADSVNFDYAQYRDAHPAP